MNRRKLFALLCALPLLGFLNPKAKSLKLTTPWYSKGRVVILTSGRTIIFQDGAFYEERKSTYSRYLVPIPESEIEINTRTGGMTIKC